MKIFKKSLISVIMICILMLNCVGCKNSSKDSSDGYLDLVDCPSTTLNNIWYNTGGIFRCAIFDSLVSTEADMKTIKPAIAEEYEILDDGMMYKFTLRDDVTWHDGEKFDVYDVLFSLKTLLRSKEVNGCLLSAFQYIEGAQEFIDGTTDDISGFVISDNTITIKLTSGNGSFLNAMAQFAILPEHILSGVELEDLESCDYWDKPIGCGPYKITEAVPNDYFILERYSQYYGEKPGVEKIKLRINVDNPVEEMRAGELDFYVTNDPEEIAKLKGAENCTAHRLNVLFPAYLIFNLSNDEGVNESLKDERVRKALLLAIDRENIVDAIFPGSTVSDTMVPTWDAWYLNDREEFSYDPEKAKQLLIDADFDFTKTIRLRYFTKGQATADLMSAIAVYWREIGINVDLEMFEGSGSEHMFNTRDYDICYKRLSAFNHAAIYEEMVGAGVMQTSIYNMPIYDELIEKLYITLDDTTKMEIVNEMQRLDQEQMLRLPLFALDNVAYVNEARFEMPEAYGNIWYRYDLHFEDWRLIY